MSIRYLQGKYKPSYPQKYQGNPYDIVYRSSWELVAFKFCDNTPEIAGWSSECVVIPYISPLDNKPHRYFVDLAIWAKQPDGTLKKHLIEIKPMDQVAKPRRGRKSDKTYTAEVMEYAKNQAKWAAAREWCLKNGWAFAIWTEADLLPGQQTYRGKTTTKRK